jgi:hypothetical protein
MSTDHIQKQWDSFRDECLTGPSTPEQMETCRRCFYAGAVGGHRAVMDAVGRADEDQNIGLTVTKAVLEIQYELEAYSLTVLDDEEVQ